MLEKEPEERGKYADPPHNLLREMALE